MSEHILKGFGSCCFFLTEIAVFIIKRYNSKCVSIQIKTSGFNSEFEGLNDRLNSKIQPSKLIHTELITGVFHVTLTAVGTKITRCCLF